MIGRKGTRFVTAAVLALVVSTGAASVVVPVASAAGSEVDVSLDETWPWPPLGRLLGRLRGRMDGRQPDGRMQFFGSSGNGINMNELLAEELGVSVEELQTAREAAQGKATDQAVEEGLITEEQADLLRALRTLRDYLDPDAILAEALGISVTDLEAARDEGKTISDLVEESGLDRETLASNARTVNEAAIQQAVEDGVISQTQADRILEDGWPGVFGGSFFDRRGGHRDRLGDPDSGELEGSQFVPQQVAPTDSL